MITSWIAPYSRMVLRIAKMASARSADADQDAGGEGYVDPPRVLENPQPYGRVLVGRTEVRAAAFGEQPGGGGLQHHAHRGRDGLQPLEVAPAQHARIEVGQQAGLLQDPDGHRPHVGQGVVVAVRVQPLAGGLPAVLGTVAEREERFLAAHGRTLAGDLQDLVRAEVRGFELVRDGGEGAVTAPVPAEPGERDEHLAAVGDDPGAARRIEPGVTDPRGGGQQLVEGRTARVQQRGRLGLVERLAIAGTGQHPAHRGVRNCRHTANSMPSVISRTEAAPTDALNLNLPEGRPVPQRPTVKHC
jgi:hypothetical protein